MLIPLVYLNVAGMYGLPSFSKVNGYLQCALAFGILLINRTYFIKGYKGIIHRAPGMDALVSIGAGISFVYSICILIAGSEGPFFFESAGMIFTLITLGKALESNSKAHTMDAINALSEIIPDNVSVIRDKEELKVKHSALRKGDIVIARSGEGISVDGIVTKGEAVIDKAALTGESLPVEVKEGDSVISGSLVKSGYLQIEAEKVGSETTLSEIIETVKNAAIEKTPIERLADKVSGVFVPVILSLSLVTFVAWILISKDFPFSLKMAINVIVISCPCALGLATPTAIMAGTGNAAERGVVIKSSECLETARKVTSVVLDKTGTVTEGELKVTDVVAKEGIKKEELLLAAAVLESVSSHPYAKAIRECAVEFVSPKDIMEFSVSDFKQIMGKGLEGFISDTKYFCGNEKLFAENGVDYFAYEETISKLRKEGKTVLLFGDSEVKGIFAISDEIRKDSREAIDELKQRGLKIYLVSGDNKETTEAIARSAGISEVVSEVLPEKKHEIVEELMKRGECVAMVGDGINDAPALVKADIGISVGSGTGVAIDSADFVLMKNSLKDIPYIFSLSEKVMRIIKQNLFWAFFYNVIGIPIAAGVFIRPFGLEFNPILAAACMSISSLFVVLNALRLRKRIK